MWANGDALNYVHVVMWKEAFLSTCHSENTGKTASLVSLSSLFPMFLSVIIFVACCLLTNEVNCVRWDVGSIRFPLLFCIIRLCCCTSLAMDFIWEVFPSGVSKVGLEWNWIKLARGGCIEQLVDAPCPLASAQHIYRGSWMYNRRE